MKHIFVICPVRNVSMEVSSVIAVHVANLERAGHIVHWPQRDTNQDDPIGLKICEQNREAIWLADEIHVWFDSSSQGSIFDLGMTFAFLYSQNKKIVIINSEMVQPTPHKSFQNVLLKLASPK